MKRAAELLSLGPKLVVAFRANAASKIACYDLTTKCVVWQAVCKAQNVWAALNSGAVFALNWDNDRISKYTNGGFVQDFPANGATSIAAWGFYLRQVSDKMVCLRDLEGTITKEIPTRHGQYIGEHGDVSVYEDVQGIVLVDCNGNRIGSVDPSGIGVLPRSIVTTSGLTVFSESRSGITAVDKTQGAVVWRYAVKKGFHATFAGYSVETEELHFVCPRFATMQESILLRLSIEGCLLDARATSACPGLAVFSEYLQAFVGNDLQVLGDKECLVFDALKDEFA